MFLKKLNRCTIQPIVIRFQEGLGRKLGFNEAIVIRFIESWYDFGAARFAYLNKSQFQAQGNKRMSQNERCEKKKQVGLVLSWVIIIKIKRKYVAWAKRKGKRDAWGERNKLGYMHLYKRKLHFATRYSRFVQSRLEKEKKPHATGEKEKGFAHGDGTSSTVAIGIN
jgi:hypothetical protein